MSAAAGKFSGDEILPRPFDSAGPACCGFRANTECRDLRPATWFFDRSAEIDAESTYINAMSRKPSTLALKTRRVDAVFVCAKCLKRSDGGARLKRRLKKQLAGAAMARNGKRPKLVLTSCLGICPKEAVVTASAGTLGRGEVVLLYNSKTDSVEEAVATLTAQRRD
jgi:hypothetical protein